MVNKINKEKLITIFISTLGIIAIIMIILKLLGHSPTNDQIILLVLGILGSEMYSLKYKFGRFEGKVYEFMKTIRNEHTKK